MRRFLVAALVPVLGGCGGGGAGSNDNVAVRDSAGIEIVENGPTSADELPLTLRETLRIGTLDGEEVYQFSGIAGIGVDPTGTVYVADATDATVRVFDADGTFVRRFGRQGQGPGEVPRISQFLFSDTLLAVSDWAKAVAFGLDGTVRGDWRLRGAAGTLYLWGIGPNGWLGSLSDPSVRYAAGSDFRESFDLRVVNPADQSTGPVLVEIPPRVWPAVNGMPTQPLFTNGGMPTFDVGPEGTVYLADTLHYEVRVSSPDGTLRRIVRLGDPPVPFDTDLVERYRSASLRQIDSLGAERGAAESDLARMKSSVEERIDGQVALGLPAFVRPMAEILPARDGSFWVRRYVLMPTDPVRWDRFDPDGSYRGNLVMPDRFRPLFADETSLTGVLRDDLDVEYVARFVVE